MHTEENQKEEIEVTLTLHDEGIEYQPYLYTVQYMNKELVHKLILNKKRYEDSKDKGFFFLKKESKHEQKRNPSFSQEE